MSAESFEKFHVGETVPVFFEAREPDPENPGRYRPMDLTGGTAKLEIFGQRDSFIITKSGFASSPQTAGKGVITLQPSDTIGQIDPRLLPHRASFKLTTVRADGYTAVQNRGRITIYP